MLRNKILISLLLCFSFIYGKNYDIRLTYDEISKEHIPFIKKETQKLFDKGDSLNYNLILCKNNCIEKSLKDEGVFLLNNAQAISSKDKNYTVSYNFVSSSYDRSRLIRTTALAIYEYLKEGKRKSIYLKNKIIPTIDLEKKDEKETLNLQEVFDFALKNNLDIKQNKNNLKLSYIDIDDSNSYYKPKVDIFSNYIQIDSDRAKYSRGLRTEGIFQVGVKLSQLIYSNKVIENIRIKKLLNKSTKDEIKALNDEIMYKTSLIYLSILKAKKFNDIIKIKYNFILQNLEFAKQRVNIGIKDNSDVYRWENELSNVSMELSNAKKQLNNLEVELFNLLQIKKIYKLQNYDIKSKLFKLLNKDAIFYVRNKEVQKAFANDIIYSHPRLKQLETLLTAKKRELKMNKSSNYLPTIAFEGSAYRNLKRFGEGKDAPRPWDDDEYQAIINLNIPLYKGGQTRSKSEKNSIELINLKLEYNKTKNLINENIHKNYESLNSSYEKIDFARSSEKFAKKNYDLVQEKYKYGKTNIIELLDAQNSYIVSKLNLNISIVDYLSDLSSIYFFAGKIDVLYDKTKKEDLENKIQDILRGLK